MNLFDKFFLPFEEGQLLIDSQKFEKKNSSSLGDVLVIAGPSGVGKDTVIKKLLEAHPEVVKVVSATTRTPRPGEKDKILFANYKDMYDYVVVSEDGDVDSVVRELSEIIKK